MRTKTTNRLKGSAIELYLHMLAGSAAFILIMVLWGANHANEVESKTTLLITIAPIMLLATIVKPISKRARKEIQELTAHTKHRASPKYADLFREALASQKPTSAAVARRYRLTQLLTAALLGYAVTWTIALLATTFS